VPSPTGGGTAMPHIIVLFAFSLVALLATCALVG
jgi:hypothetical protein